MNSRVFVVGLGYTGTRLAARLEHAVGVSRSPSPDGASEQVRLDLDAEAASPLEIQAGDSIVYTMPPDRNHDRDVRLERLQSLLSSPPARFVYLSTTGVYGDHDGGQVDESTPVTPATDRARRRVAAERTLGDECRASGAALVVLRVPGIYGPGRLGTDRLRTGTSVIAEAEAGPGNRIHVADLVHCCIAALSPDVPAGIYNVGDGDRRSATWFLGEVARQAGLPPPAVVSRAEANEQWSPMRLSFLSETRRVSIRKMLDVLQPELRYSDPVAGVSASLAEERAEAERQS